jgi:hypothetical protein
MKIAFTTLIAFTIYSVIALSEVAQDKPQRYSYQVTGSVLDAQSKPMARVAVCLIPSGRPIGGEVQCAKTTDNGRFSVGSEDIPDKYNVCASSTADLPYASQQADSSEKRQRVKCTETMVFGTKDESREVTIKFGSE